MALSRVSTHSRDDSAPAATGFLHMFMEANALAGRTASREPWARQTREANGPARARRTDTLGDRRPE